MRVGRMWKLVIVIDVSDGAIVEVELSPPDKRHKESIWSCRVGSSRPRHLKNLRESVSLIPREQQAFSLFDKYAKEVVQ